MTELQRTKEFRQKAIEALPHLYDSEVGIKASGDGRYAAFWTRDFSIFLLLASHPDNFNLPGLFEHTLKSIETINRYRGKKMNFHSDEEFGRAPHEVHTEKAGQERLTALLKGGMPVKKNPATNRLYMVNYYAGDATSLANQATAAAVRMVDLLYGRTSGDSYLESVWPDVKKGLAHDLQNVLAHGKGVPVTYPKSGEKFRFQTWRDGDRAYLAEDGYNPKAPLIFLPNAAHFVKSLRDTAVLADRMGEGSFSNSLKLNAESAQASLEKLFWSEKLGTYLPIIDKNGPLEMINNDPVFVVFCGVGSDPKVQRSIDRMMEVDMKTNYGIRTRSLDSEMFTIEGTEAYQRGSIWPNLDTALAIGALNYGRSDVAKDILRMTNNYIGKAGFKELMICTKEGELELYLEDGQDVAPNTQSWVVGGYLGLSARMIGV